jgi:O-antigen/teichoic acid export membrane protein
MLSALTAIGCAYSGWGVWTLVAAPGVYWWARAIGFSIAARLLVWPSFRFGGAGKLFSFGSAIIVVQFFWFVQSQADVFIGGRVLDAHQLGIYTTALFLTQILAAKFVPPLNEIAFAAYSRLQDQSDVVQSAFLKSVRLIMLVALPFYFGLAVTAEPLVLTFLGPKWAETVAIVPILALAMPFMTLQILFSPATNALGRPGIAVRTGLAGAILMPAVFLVGINWGMEGLAWAWLGGMAVLCSATAMLSLPTIGIKGRAFLGSIGPGLLASAAMGALVFLFDSQLAKLAPPARLALLVSFGAAAYAGLLLVLARATVDEAIQLIRPGAKASAAQAL